MGISVINRFYLVMNRNFGIIQGSNWSRIGISVSYRFCWVMNRNFVIIQVLMGHAWEFRYYTDSDGSCMGISVSYRFCVLFLCVSHSVAGLAATPSRPLALSRTKMKSVIAYY